MLYALLLRTGQPSSRQQRICTIHTFFFGFQNYGNGFFRITEILKITETPRNISPAALNTTQLWGAAAPTPTAHTTKVYTGLNQSYTRYRRRQTSEEKGNYFPYDAGGEISGPQARNFGKTTSDKEETKMTRSQKRPQVRDNRMMIYLKGRIYYFSQAFLSPIDFVM